MNKRFDKVESFAILVRKLLVVAFRQRVSARLSLKPATLKLFKTWHIRHDWSFTPFVVVVGGKYFLPVPDCLLFDQESLSAVPIFCCA